MCCHVSPLLISTVISKGMSNILSTSQYQWLSSKGNWTYDYRYLITVKLWQMLTSVSIIEKAIYIALCSILDHATFYDIYIDEIIGYAIFEL